MAYRALPAQSDISPLSLSRAPTNGSTHSLSRAPTNASTHFFFSVKSTHSFSSFRSKPEPEPHEPQLKQIIRLSGADARLTLPTYLLPHHEHHLPPPPPPSSDPLFTSRHKQLSD